METLKPCPFCGGSVSVQRMIGTWYENGEETEYDSYQWAILHNEWFTSRCPADTFTEHKAYRTLDCPEADAQKQRIIKAWNTRAERTCKDVNGGGYTFVCSECTYELHMPFGWNFRYCPNCGAKVVD